MDKKVSKEESDYKGNDHHNCHLKAKTSRKVKLTIWKLVYGPQCILKLSLIKVLANTNLVNGIVIGVIREKTSREVGLTNLKIDVKGLNKEAKTLREVGLTNMKIDVEGIYRKINAHGKDLET